MTTKEFKVNDSFTSSLDTMYGCTPNPSIALTDAEREKDTQRLIESLQLWRECEMKLI